MADPETTSPPTAAFAALERLGPIAVESRLISKAEYQAVLRALRATPPAGTKVQPACAVTIKVAAARLGCCTKTILRLIERRQLPAFKLTGSRKSLRIPESAITALAQGKCMAE
jgi:excisionase family DNA binding protein